MPCHQINLISLKFTVKSRDRLIKSLKDLGYGVTDCGNTIFTTSMEFNLKAGKVIIETSRFSQNNTADLVNRVKRKYSENTLKDLAKKKRWALRQREENKYAMTRY